MSAGNQHVPNAKRDPEPQQHFVAGERSLQHYAEMSEERLHGFWERKNLESIDGLTTNIFTDGH